MLSSQTKDTTNAIAMRRLQTELSHPGLTLENILALSPEKLNELIWVVGFHNNKARHIKATALILRDQWESDIPDTVEGLMSLPGVGPKMAYLCMSAAWGRIEGIGVDVHVHRITNLWGWHKTRMPEETRTTLEAWLPKDRWHEINHLLVGFGQTICLPVGRRCGECVLSEMRLCPSAVVERKKGYSRNRTGRREIEATSGDAKLKTREDTVDMVAGNKDVREVDFKVGYTEDPGEDLERTSQSDTEHMDRISNSTRLEGVRRPRHPSPQLPNELLLQIFSYSSSSSLISARLTCKLWHHLVPPEMLFNKISISSECNDLQYLNELASHGIYSKCVRELICPSWTYDSFGLALEKPRMDFNDLRGGYYFGSSALHMYPETFQQTVQAFSNIETLRLSLDVFQHPMSGVWRPFSTALGSLRCLQSLTIHVDVTYDPENTQRALLSDVFGSNIWPHLISLKLETFHDYEEELVDLLVKHCGTLKHLRLRNRELLEGTWEGLFDKVLSSMHLAPIGIQPPLLDPNGSDRYYSNIRRAAFVRLY